MKKEYILKLDKGNLHNFVSSVKLSIKDVSTPNEDDLDRISRDYSKIVSAIPHYIYSTYLDSENILFIWIEDEDIERGFDLTHLNSVYGYIEAIKEQRKEYLKKLKVNRVYRKLRAIDDTIDKANAQHRPIRFSEMMVLLFLGMKLSGHIDWSWLAIVSPVIISFIFKIIIITTNYNKTKK